MVPIVAYLELMQFTFTVVCEIESNKNALICELYTFVDGPQHDDNRSLWDNIVPSVGADFNVFLAPSFKPKRLQNLTYLSIRHKLEAPKPPFLVEYFPGASVLLIVFFEILACCGIAQLSPNDEFSVSGYVAINY